MNKVYTKEERSEQLKDVGAQLGSKHGVANVTRRMIANEVGVSEPLVSVYLGNGDDMRKVIKTRMRKLKLSEPAKGDIAAIGTALRKHRPRDPRDTRKRSAQEVEAIKRKRTGPSKTKVIVPSENKERLSTGVADKKTAARPPKAPPLTNSL